MTQIVLRTPMAEAEALPEHGFVISSFRDRQSGAEAFWRRRKPPARRCSRSLGPPGDASIGTFLELFVGGCFEMFPSAGGPGASGLSFLHGETARLPWTVTGQTATSVSGRVELPASPFVVERHVSLNDAVLRIDSRVRNQGDGVSEYAWGFHPCFSRETFAGGTIDLHASRAVVAAPPADERRALLLAGHEFTWPDAQGRDGTSVHAGSIPREPDGRHDHMCVTSWQGDVVITAPEYARRLRITRDQQVLPHLLLWQYYAAEGPPFFGSVDTFTVEPITYFGRDMDDALGSDAVRSLDPGSAASVSLAFAWEECS